MALVVFDRVQETTATTGTGTITLGGAVAGYQSFAVIGNGNTTFYCITNGSQWEVGVGTYSTTGPTLARTTIYSNSNGNTSPITLVGASNVFVTYPAGRSVNLDASGNVTALGTVSSGVWQGTTIGVAYGGTGVTSSSGANSVMLRDANQNVAVNRLNQSNTTTTAAGGTTALTTASTYIHSLVGTGGQTYTLPDATTLATGVAFLFNNLATGTLTLQDYATGPIGTIPTGGAGAVFLTNNGTTGGTWDLHAYLPEGVTFGTNAFNLGTAVVSGGTWQGGTIQPAYGGTGLTTFAAANNALYSTGASTLTAGTLPVAAGGTGLTSLTANRIPYGAGTSALGNSSALTFDGASTLSVTASAVASVEGVFTNTNTGVSASAGVQGKGNSTGYFLLRQYGTGVTATVFGITLANYALLLSDGASSNGLMLGSLTADPVIFGSNNAERMRIFSSGGVSIGNTTDPGATNLSVTGTGSFSAGTVSLPAITTAGDTNTGMFFPAADTIAFTEGGVERMRITSAGDVGIGTSSPTADLDIAASTSPELRLTSASDGFLQIGMFTNGAYIGTSSSDATDGVLKLGTATVERMRIDSSGLVGIGKTPSGYQLDIDAGANNGLQTTQTALTCQNIISTDDTASGMNIQYFKDSASPAASDSIALVRSFGRSSTGVQREYSRVTTVATVVTNAAEAGQYAIAIMAAGTLTTKLQLNATSIRAIEAYTLTTASAANMNVDTNGVFARSTSSIRYKTQVEDLAEPNSANIYNMRPVWYRSTCEKDNKDWSWYGLIAEEVAEIDPRLVHWGYGQDQYDITYIENEGQQEEVKTLKEDAELQPEGVQYDRLTVLLVQEMKALKTQVEAQALEIQALKTR
jgi:hypothetical protein